MFENYSKRHPATNDDPKATARNYLIDRGFNSGLIADWYEQGYYHLKDGTMAPTVRIPLWKNSYWERLIDRQHVQQAGRKNNYPKGFGFADECWKPAGLELNNGDHCHITEGIFNAWVFLQEGKKAVSAMNSGNLPRKLIKEKSGLMITWVICYDNDKAGLGKTLDHIEWLEELGERYQVMLTASSSRDWNDELIAGNINQEYFNTCLWRGYIHTAKNAREKAFWQFVKFPKRHICTSFHKALYSFTVDQKAITGIYEALDIDSNPKALNGLWVNGCEDSIQRAQTAFYSEIKGSRISNCLPSFLYIERDPLTEEQDYFFNIAFMNGNKTRLIAMDGSSIESASSLNKSLLGKTPGGTFDGDAKDIKDLKEQWFNSKTTEIKRLRFIGYDKDSGAWVFPEFGFCAGKLIKNNDHGYLNTGKDKLKTKVSGNQIKMIRRDYHDERWIQLFHKTFGDTGLIVMAWWYCTLFSEHIRAKYQDWPFLELTGEPGTGKTTLLKFLWRCIGRIDGYEGFDPAKSSMAGRSRTLERYSALPTVVIEADRADKPGAKKSFDFNEFKDFFNGGIIRTTGVKNGGNETIEPPFRGGVLIAQNASIESDDDAVMERIVHCHSTKSHHTSDSKQLARQMASMKADELCGWLHQALSNERRFLAIFDQKLTEIQNDFRQRNEIVRERITENHSKIAAGVWCLNIIFPEYMTFDVCSRLTNEVWAMAVSREKRIKADSPLVEQFWEYYADLNFIEYEDGGTREFVSAERLNHSSNKDQIAINLVEFEKLANKHGLRIPIAELK
ncbi:MAG: toprim domain-containing protein, partial [Endozoicomonas sp.]